MASDKEVAASVQQNLNEAKEDVVKPVVKELRSIGDTWTDLKLAARVSRIHFYLFGGNLTRLDTHM